MPPLKTVDQYIAAKPQPARDILARVRHAIRAALPDAEESISYDMPTYKIDGQPVIYLAGWKRHFSIYPSSVSIEVAFKDELAPYEIEKGTIRFPFADPPIELIARIATFRAQEAASPARQAKRK